jgi:O-antigen/teichoic acid export membrane protein
VVKFLVESFNLAWNPFAYQNEGAPDERRIYELSFKGLFGAIAITGFTLSVFAGEVLAILAPAEYAGARLLVPGLALYMGVEGLTLILSTVLYTRSMVRWASYLNGVRVVVFLAVAVPLIRLHEAAGLVVALDLSVLVYLIWYLHKARQGLMFRVPWRRMVAVGLGAVGLIVALETVAMGEVATIAVKLSVSLLFGAVVVTTLFSRRERSVAQGAIRRFVGGGLGRA